MKKSSLALSYYPIAIKNGKIHMIGIIDSCLSDRCTVEETLIVEE